MIKFHQSVLVNEVLHLLNVKSGSWFLDATLGDGGHSLEILKQGGNVVEIDVDPEALSRAKQRFQKAGIDDNKYILIQANFRDLKSLVSRKFSGILFDLGVSSLQLEKAERGFSFQKDAPMDMRMDPTLSVTAADLVNGLNKGELTKLFLTLGEEKQAKKIAQAIVNFRSHQPISTTLELAKIVEKVISKRGRIHPATKVFQALRIAVNDELNALKETLPQAWDLLLPGGKIVVISFHSLEDRIVKNFFKEKHKIVAYEPSARLRWFEKS